MEIIASAPLYQSGNAAVYLLGQRTVVLSAGNYGVHSSPKEPSLHARRLLLVPVGGCFSVNVQAFQGESSFV